MTMELYKQEIWRVDEGTGEKHLFNSRYDWRPTHEFTRTHELDWKWKKGATNPPEVIAYWEELCTSRLHCEDGWYVVPTQHLAEGVSAGMQHRELIGIHSA